MSVFRLYCNWFVSDFTLLSVSIYLFYSLLDNSDHQAGGDSLRGRVPVLVLDLRVSVHSEQGNGMLLHQQWRLQVKVNDKKNARNLAVVVNHLQIGKHFLFHRIAVWIITKVNHGGSEKGEDCSFLFYLGQLPWVKVTMKTIAQPPSLRICSGNYVHPGLYPRRYIESKENQPTIEYS